MSEIKIVDTTLRVKPLICLKINEETATKEFVGIEYHCPWCSKILSYKYSPEFTKCKSCGIELNWGKRAPHITKETIYNVIWDDYGDMI